MLYIIIYFFIGFISDVILNYLSRQSYAPMSIKALKIYFLRPSIKNSLLRDIISAVNAGLTIVAAALITIMLSKWIFHFSHPRSLKQLAKFLLLAFPVGYLMDIAIDRTALFGPTLKPFYAIAGSGFWGAAAFIFSVILCYVFINRYIDKRDIF